MRLFSEGLGRKRCVKTNRKSFEFLQLHQSQLFSQQTHLLALILETSRVDFAKSHLNVKRSRQMWLQRCGKELGPTEQCLFFSGAPLPLKSAHDLQQLASPPVISTVYTQMSRTATESMEMATKIGTWKLMFGFSFQPRSAFRINYSY